jgi:hypothetical protein
MKKQQYKPTRHTENCIQILSHKGCVKKDSGVRNSFFVFSTMAMGMVIQSKRTTTTSTSSLSINQSLQEITSPQHKRICTSILDVPSCFQYLPTRMKHRSRRPRYSRLQEQSFTHSLHSHITANTTTCCRIMFHACISLSYLTTCTCVPINNLG